MDSNCTYNRTSVVAIRLKFRLEKNKTVEQTFGYSRCRHIGETSHRGQENFTGKQIPHEII